MRKIVLGVSLLTNIILVLIILVDNIKILENPVINCLNGLANIYVSGVVCSVIGVILIFAWQLKYSKYKLKKDFRCGEIMSVVAQELETVEKISKEMPSIHGRIGSDEYNKSCENVYEFYQKNKVKLWFSATVLSGHNNDILIESVQACFFLNLNFEVLGIVNNIKNRLPNIREGEEKLNDLYKQLEDKNNCTGRNESLCKFAEYLSRYVQHLNFLAQYWDDLISYLNFDREYQNKFLHIFVSLYPDDNILDYSHEEQLKMIEEIDKITRKELNRKKKMSERFMDWLLKKV